MALIRLSGVGKQFPNGTRALEDCSLTIEDGEFVSLLGPSGCGKSTVLRLVAGLAAPSAGTLVASDHQPMGFVFQEASLMPWASVEDNVALPLRIEGLERVELQRRTAEALEQVGLRGFERVYPRELSGGMKMRVSIARAMVTRPRLLLMDEPFAALDEITRIKLNNDVLALWQQLRLTVVFVTHSVYESVYLSSRIVVMSSRPGRVINSIAIDSPYPRDEEFRTSAPYGAYCRAVSRSLRSATAQQPQPASHESTDE